MRMIANMIKTTGGSRRNAGRKTELTGQPVGRKALTLDDRTVRLLAVLGDGNLSKGVRVAADVAYSRYQNS
jgi:hypothetical protein